MDETNEPMDLAETLEIIGESEPDEIDSVVGLTIAQLRQRFPDGDIRRGVHPKDHGCVKATFTVNEALPKHLRVGLFANPGQSFSAYIRFSNADVTHDKPDSPTEEGKLGHGSRGMAIKVLGACGTPISKENLVTTNGPISQDFLLINQPVFAFANIVDYHALSEVLLRDHDVPRGFFARISDPDLDEESRTRAMNTLKIIGRIRSLQVPEAYQPPPGSPLDNRYFSAAPFLFGPGRVAKFAASPKVSAGVVADFEDANYLRIGLRNRLASAAGQDIVFDFQVQIRDAAELQDKRETEIEDVCTEWVEGEGPGQFPFQSVAQIRIATPQDIDSPDRMALCEDLFFTPWNCLAEHRPLGGINRLRRTVYEASMRTRHKPARCPFRI